MSILIYRHLGSRRTLPYLLATSMGYLSAVGALSYVNYWNYSHLNIGIIGLITIAQGINTRNVLAVDKHLANEIWYDSSLEELKILTNNEEITCNIDSLSIQEESPMPNDFKFVRKVVTGEVSFYISYSGEVLDAKFKDIFL